MNRLKIAAAALVLTLPVLSCASYQSQQKARDAEKMKNWDEAVVQYEKALSLDPNNMAMRMGHQRARLEASRTHFEKGKSLRTAAQDATGGEQVRLARLASTEFELTVKLDPTNQYAAVELGKVIAIIEHATRAANGPTIEEIKKRGISKAQPPQLNPASNEPISLSFPRETPVKDIYRALGNAFGINILFDQAVKDDRIAIELRDVTAQQALERVMQAANHFYKVLDEKTLIVVPDNPQARRDYEDLVIQTFYLSNGDAEQVTNVVRTMIEARNVFPLKAMNAITIRDTADKVRIAEKIIEANDKARAEVVVDVELLQMDVTKARNIGTSLSTSGAAVLTGPDGKAVGAMNLDQIRHLSSNLEDRTFTREDGSTFTFPGSTGVLNFTIPSLAYNFAKSASNSELLANPELRISEGEKATLHIGQRIPVPVSTFSSVNTSSAGGAFAPVTSFQYQDIGIKVAVEPRVHHNREVTLKLTVEVSSVGGSVPGGEGQPDQPIISTRTIESTIRLKDGETNFLAGLIQDSNTTSTSKIPILGDLPIIGRIFSNEKKDQLRNDLVLTMTPHIIRVPDITDDDVAPMWVGTTNNLTFRGVSPRIESQSGLDPFTVPRPTGAQFNGRDPNTGLPLADGEPGNVIQPAPVPVPGPTQGSGPDDPFNKPTSPVTPVPQASLTPAQPKLQLASASAGPEMTAYLSPRIAPQPANLKLKPGEERIWNVVGMDIEGLTTTEISLHYDPRSLDVADVGFGSALVVDPRTPPSATINRETGTVRVVSTDGKPLRFQSGGEVLQLRVRGGNTGETFLVMDSPDLKDVGGKSILSAISGGRAKVE